MNKRTWTKAGVAVIVLVLGYLWVRPQPFEREYSSVIYANDTGIVKQISIALSGAVVRGLPLLTSGKFDGVLTIDDDLNYEVKLKNTGSYFLGNLTTRNEDHSVRSIGAVTVSKRLDKFWIMLTDMDERYGLKNGEGYIAGPARTPDEARRVGKSILDSP